MDFKKLILSSFVLLGADYLYLSSHSSYFRSVFEKIQKQYTINIFAVVLCYIAIVVMLNYFIIQKYSNTSKAMIRDAFVLGFTTYLIYEATNYATLKNWPLYLVVVDSIWGGILFTTVSYVTLKIRRAI